MQINIALDQTNDFQAKSLRDDWFGGNVNSSQVRASFVFNIALDKFDAKQMDELPEIIKRDKDKPTVQRMLTIKQESNKKLEDISAAIGASKAATLRAIISYWVDKIGVTGKGKEEKPVKSEEISQTLMVKIALLEKQLNACTQTLKEIKGLTK